MITDNTLLLPVLFLAAVFVGLQSLYSVFDKLRTVSAVFWLYVMLYIDQLCQK
jgi:hypothetical protein